MLNRQTIVCLWADGEQMLRLNVHNLHCLEQSVEQDSDLQNVNKDLRHSHLDQSLSQALDHIHVYHIYVFHLDKDLDYGLGQ